MTDPELFYLSASEYRGRSLAPALLDGLGDDAIESLLLETMVEIDSYIGPGWIPLDDGQEFIFPRLQDTDDDDEAYIPRPVTIATRMIADAILERRSKGILPHEIQSETNLAHSYSRRTRASEAPLGFEHWPTEAFAKLDPLRKVGGSLAMSYPDTLEFGRVQ